MPRSNRRARRQHPAAAEGGCSRRLRASVTTSSNCSPRSTRCSSVSHWRATLARLCRRAHSGRLRARRSRRRWTSTSPQSTSLWCASRRPTLFVAIEAAARFRTRSKYHSALLMTSATSLSSSASQQSLQNKSSRVCTTMTMLYLVLYSLYCTSYECILSICLVFFD